MLAAVIICTHNPCEDCLQRALAALRTQTLPKDQWELLLIDNASKSHLSTKIDLSWHPNSRHVREDELGLTPARLRGIKESQSDILIFVDDDNVLAANYLEQALIIAKEWPFIGAWGGSLIPEFAIDPPSWCLDEPWRISILEVKEDAWSNLREGFATIPAGGGMCIRKSVGDRFIEWCRINGQNKTMDRTGTAITGYGDADLAHCSMDIGLGTGRFTRLSLTHLIPASRLTLDYLLRHAEGDAASFMMFRAVRGLPIQKPDHSLLREIRWRLHQLLSRKPIELLKIKEASRKGEKTGWKLAQRYWENQKLKTK